MERWRAGTDLESIARRPRAWEGARDGGKEVGESRSAQWNGIMNRKGRNGRSREEDLLGIVVGFVGGLWCGGVVGAGGESGDGGGIEAG